MAIRAQNARKLAKASMSRKQNKGRKLEDAEDGRMKRSDAWSVGRLEGRVDGLEARLDRSEDAFTKRIDRHEAVIEARFMGFDTKLDSIQATLAETGGANRFGRSVFRGVATVVGMIAAIVATIATALHFKG